MSPSSGLAARSRNPPAAKWRSASLRRSRDPHSMSMPSLFQPLVVPWIDGEEQHHILAARQEAIAGRFAIYKRMIMSNRSMRDDPPRRSSQGQSTWARCAENHSWIFSGDYGAISPHGSLRKTATHGTRLHSRMLKDARETTTSASSKEKYILVNCYAATS